MTEQWRPGDDATPVPAQVMRADPAAGGVLGIGELLWDLLPSGPRLGGAPFNVVAHLRRFGHPAAYLTAVGDDRLGTAALQEVRRLGVSDALVSVTGRAPTGTVGVELDERGVPEFEIRSPAAYELIAPLPSVLATVSASPPRAVVFGTLAQRRPAVLAATSAVLAAAPDALRVYDVNLRRGTWDPELVVELAGRADVLKLNDEELGVLGPALALPHADAEAFAAAAAGRFGLRAVCVTEGARGALLWTRGGAVRAAGIRVVVADTVGAGDAFTAGLVHGLLAGVAAREALGLANALGALVASRSGAIPDWTPADLDALTAAGAGGDARPAAPPAAG